jgi:hypothetical protein
MHGGEYFPDFSITWSFFLLSISPLYQPEVKIPLARGKKKMKIAKKFLGIGHRALG